MSDKMKSLYIDIYTEEPCNPDLVAECERFEITAEMVKKWLADQGMVVIYIDEGRRERAADAAIESMVRLSKRIAESDWYKDQGK